MKSPIREKQIILLAMFLLLLSGCGREKSDVAVLPEQPAPAAAGPTLNFDLVDLEKQAADMRASGTGNEGAALADVQSKIQQTQNQISLESVGTSK
jgi:hypothetical protein